LRTFLKYNLYPVFWGLFIILLTILPGKVFPRIPVFLDLFQPDKLIHLFIFSVYVYLQIRGFVMQTDFPTLRKNAVFMTMLISLFLAAGTELVQAYFVQMRNGSIYDFMANAAGCLVWWWFAGKLKIKAQKF
jgi:VanZ family protein